MINNSYLQTEDEWYPLVDEQGKVIGKARRSECHGGMKPLHPVVHLHVFNNRGELYLQKRPMSKDIQPGKWDTSVGGHVDYGETTGEALRRETREELGISDFIPDPIVEYIFESDMEKEFVHSFKTIYDGEITPAPDELDGGRFWKLDEIRQNIGKNIFTPNFENEFEKYVDCM